MQINPFYAVDKPHGKDREDEAEFPAEEFDRFFSRYSFSEGKWMIRKNEVPALVKVVEDHLDELAFGTFKPGCGARTEDGAVEVKGKMVTGQMGRNDPMMKLTVYVTVDGIDMTLDVYMTFENGEWVIDAYQADVDHDEVKVKDTNKGGMKKMKENKYGLASITYPPTEHGVHWAAYPGWVGDDVIISSGGYVDGVYIPASEVYSARPRLWDRLSPEVKAEMEPLAGDPGYWNDKILELKQEGVSHEDEELLDALWVSGKVCEGEVTIYGTDDGVTKMDESNLREMGLDRLDSDDDDEDEDE